MHSAFGDLTMARKFVAPVAATLLAIPICAYADQRSGKVDQLFSRWNTSPTSIPGMNIAVWRDGKRIYSRSFGMANLEFSQPNDAKLVYPIGSISKQFVGYCIQLLASEGELALRDDARLYLPELHDFGEKITLQMLLNHTSGVRDSVSLLIAKGRRVDDVVSVRSA